MDKRLFVRLFDSHRDFSIVRDSESVVDDICINR